MSSGFKYRVGGSTEELEPGERHYSGRSRRSKTCIFAGVSAALFLVLAVVFIILYAKEVSSNDDKVSPDSKANQQGTVTQTTPLPEGKPCQTDDCYAKAAEMVKKMNLTADPCQDFNEYACGRFIKEAVLPVGITVVDTFDTVVDSNDVVMRDIVSEEVLLGEPDYLSNMKRLYASCMNEDKIEEVGLKPFLTDDPNIIDLWPTLNSNWTGENYTLSDVIYAFELKYVEALFSFFVDLDERNSSRKLIYLQDPTQTLPPEYLKNPRNDTVIMAYEKYLADTAIELGANETVAKEDAEDVVNLQIALAKIMVPKEDRRDSSVEYNPVPLKDLLNTSQELDIPRALRAAFSLGAVNLSDDQIVVNRFPTYIGNITKVLSEFHNRTILNLFGFKYAIARIEGLTTNLRAIRLEFDKVYKGITAERPRWQVCLDVTSNSFTEGMSKQYVNRTFPKSSKDYIETMIENLKKSFKQMINETTWMVNTTKQNAFIKLEDMKKKIGYPDTGFDDSDIEADYSNYRMSNETYYYNNILVDYLDSINDVQSLLIPFDPTEFAMAPYIVNAQYSPNANDITFPAGILQDPFFSPKFSDSINYGGIGVVIGHEITHGFDDQGSQYDEHGNLKDWWAASDREQFLNRTQCIVDQNANFCMPEIQKDLCVNGINTQGESAADNGGVKESFRAYRELTSTKPPAPKLPGLDLSQDQLFFLSFAQIWCTVMTPERLIQQVTTNEHPPGKFRIIGPLQNSPDFAKAYNCPVGSFMNPVKKCSVW